MSLFTPSIGGDSSASYMSAGSLGSMMYAAELQQKRSMRMFSNLTKQAEQEASQQLHWAEKQARKETQIAAYQEIREAERRQRAEEAASLEVHRKARADAAMYAEEEVREAARAKVQAGDTRVAHFELERREAAKRDAAHAAATAARRDATYENGVAMQDARRMDYEARHEAAEKMLRHREELRRLDLDIKNEEAFLRSEARAAAKARAEADQEYRTQHIVAVGQAKDAAVHHWQQESVAVRRLKAQEARARSEYIQLQARAAAEANEAVRSRIRAHADGKAARVEAIVRERKGLANQLQRVRHSMQQQESAVRSSLDLLRRSGAPFALPPSVAASLAFAGPGLSGSMSSFSMGRPGSVAGSQGRYGQRSYSAASVHASPTAVGAFKRVRPVSAAVAARYGNSNPQSSPHAKALAGGQYGSAYTTAGPVAINGVARHEAELRLVLRQEIDKEAERQGILAGIADGGEASRLSVIFAAEREGAKRRILALSSAVHTAMQTGVCVTSSVFTK